MDKALLFIISFVSFIVLDLVWFKLFTNKIFLELIRPIARLKNDSFDVNYISAGVVYILLALGVCYFVLSEQSSSYRNIAFSGALLGLITYGIYDFTNHALLAHWPTKMIILDVGWGICSCALVSVFTFYIKDKL